MSREGPVHDRALLLPGAKRNVVLELAEIERYGLDSHRDPDYVSIYGLLPAEWYAKGIRLLGRTAVECAIQVFEQVDAASLDEVTARFDWSALRVYRLNGAGRDHGVLLGTCGWAP